MTPSTTIGVVFGGRFVGDNCRAVDPGRDRLDLVD
jgi:hypothetical protein